MASQAKRHIPKRASSASHKATRERSWNRGDRRKKNRAAAQRERETANRERRRLGNPTPWETACLERYLRRHPVVSVTEIRG